MDELVKELRDSAEWADRLALLMGRAEGDAHAPIMREAADAIEELQAQNNELLFRCGQAEALIDYYQTGKLPSNEPPKEE